MGKEIERKYLVQSDAWRSQVQSKEHYRQGYLSIDEARSVRIRVGQRTAFLTVKGKSTGHTRLEFEYPLPLAEAQQMLEQLCLKPLIAKTRHTVHANGLTWEIDEFADENRPLVMAELESETDEEPTQKPAWIGEEVTRDPRYFNINLVAHPYSTWRHNGQKLETTFHLKGGESVPTGLGRIMQEQFTVAIAQLGRMDEDLAERVHEVRKSVKRLRAVIRLMRPVFGSAYQEENVALRDIGRALSVVRDAHALVETLNLLSDKYHKELGEDGLPFLRRTIIAYAQEREHNFAPTQQIPRLIEELKVIGQRAKSWPYENTDIHVLTDGVATTIRRGRKSYRTAYAVPTAEHFHDWRKRVKDLRYQLALLEKLWPEVFDGFSRTAKELEERLGMDHNLVVLRNMLPTGETKPTLHYEVRLLRFLIAAYQRELRNETRSLGSRLFSETPMQWARRIEHSWKAQKEERRTKKLQDNHPLPFELIRHT